MFLPRALLLLLCMPSLVWAQKLHTVPGTPAPGDEPMETRLQDQPAVVPMRFFKQNACGDVQDPSTCQAVVLARGEITEATPDALEAFLQEPANRQLTELYLDSSGGSVIAALRVGLLIRRAGLDTVVAPQMRCLSACVYTFLGGVSRSVRIDSIVGVHRFFSTEGPDGNLDDSQRLVALISEYATGMGASYEIMRVVSQASGQSMVRVTPQLAQRLDVDNTNPPPQTWSLKPEDDGLRMFVNQTALSSDREASVALSVDGVASQMAVVFEEPSVYSTAITQRELAGPVLGLVCRVSPNKELTRDKCVVAEPTGPWRALKPAGRFGLLLNFPTKSLKALEGGTNEDFILVTVRSSEARKSVLMLRTSADGFNAALRAVKSQ